MKRGNVVHEFQLLDVEWTQSWSVTNTCGDEVMLIIVE